MAPHFPGAHQVIALAALVLSLSICLNARWLGRHLSVMDVPDSERKRHAEPTPLVGGIAILIALLIWQLGELYVFPAGDAAVQKVLLFCGAGVAAMGFIDDQTPTYPLVRLLSLLIFVGIAFTIDPSLITTGLTWTSGIFTALPTWGYLALMSVSVVGLVNAANMADGLNGLLTGLFLIWALCLTLVSDGAGYCPLILMGAAAIVFLFNLPGRLFLGDCGSYGVTFIIAILSIRAHASSAITVATVIVWFFIPITDCLRLMITRWMSGRSPLSADRDHFHHRLEARFGSPYAVAIYLGSVAATSILASVLPDFAPWCIVALALFYGAAIWRTAERPQGQIVFRFDRLQSPAPTSSGSVVKLAKANADTDDCPDFADGAFGVSGQDTALPYTERKSARQAG
jgi:UDP-GlcNAc:undecaprenyl-phosphate/decaprenyl-phosphate GlcNAc-1-phosphate transferase